MGPMKPPIWGNIPISDPAGPASNSFKIWHSILLFFWSWGSVMGSVMGAHGFFVDAEIIIRMFPKIGIPQIIHFNRVFHYFHHPFWGIPIFGNTHQDQYIYNFQTFQGHKDSVCDIAVARRCCFKWMDGNGDFQSFSIYIYIDSKSSQVIANEI